MQGKVFKSGVGWWYYLSVLVVAAAFAVSASLPGGWPVALVCGMCVLLMLDILLHTDYAVSGGVLRVRCGMFCREKISVADIRAIEPTRSPISAAALSLCRLRITYGKYGETIVSPKLMDEFVAALKEQNGNIDVKRRTLTQRP